MLSARTRLLTIAVALSAACRSYEPPTPPRRVVRLVNNTTMSAALAREYARALPWIDVRLVDAVGSVAAVNAIRRGDADVTFAFANVAYFSQLQPDSAAGPAAGSLRGIAALHVSPIHLLSRPGLRVRSVSDLRGLRVGTGEARSGQTVLAELILQAYGLPHDISPHLPLPVSSTLDALEHGSVDAAFTMMYYPAELVTAAMSAGAHLVPIEGPVVERLTEEYPFIQSVSIPKHTYPGQTRAVRTIGLERLLLCRGDLDERLVHELTVEFFKALPHLGDLAHTSLRLMDLAHGSATPIPLHKGAALYYRERELTQ